MEKPEDFAHFPRSGKEKISPHSKDSLVRIEERGTRIPPLLFKILFSFEEPILCYRNFFGKIYVLDRMKQGNPVIHRFLESFTS